MSVLKPKIKSIVNGTITVLVDSVSAVESLFDQLIIFSGTTSNGSFSSITTISLDGSESYSYTDLSSSPSLYYKAQYHNSSSLISSTFSELAQETGIYSEYSLPVSTATYPPEIALSEDDRLIVESIRTATGDLGLLERDYYDSSSVGCAVGCSNPLSADLCTWELRNFKGWPQDIRVDGQLKTSLTDPMVRGYRYLTFTGTSCVTGTLDVFYIHFRFSDREILLAYDRARNLLVACGLTSDLITSEMLIMQAAILLLEGELRESYNESISITDGDTSYDNTSAIRSRTSDLEDLKNKLRELIKCAMVYGASYRVRGVRID